MTLKEAYREWSAIKAHKPMAEAYQDPVRTCLMDRFGNTELSLFSDQFICQAFETAQADTFFKAYASTFLQSLLVWVRKEKKDPDYRETAFEKRGLEFIIRTPDYIQSVTLLNVRDCNSNDDLGFLRRSYIFTRRIRMVEVKYLSRVYKGIGLLNESGGMEFYAPEMPFSPVTIGKPGIVYIPQLSMGRSNSCCLFADILDCFGYQSMLLEKQPGYIENCDYIIMNGPGNFGSMTVDSDLYEKIYLFFPDTDYGHVASLTLQQRNKNAVDLSHFFSGFSSLTDMIRHRRAII